jgi:translocation-and-assembly-module (TAM) inner membrane subunit TamB-like protein
MYIFSQSSVVQTSIIQSITENFFQRLGANIKIKKVDFRFFNRIVLKEVVIEDQQKDTLFYFDELVGNFMRFSTSERKMFFSKITGKNSKINLLVDEETNINIQFLVDELNRRDTTKARWHILANHFDLQNSEFIYKRSESMNKSFGVDLYDMSFSEFNFSLKDFQILEGDITFKIKNFSFLDKSGFRVENFSAKTFINSENFNFEDIHLKTPFSELKSDFFNMSFNNFKDFTDFNNNINLDWNIKSSKLNLGDIAYFSENLYGLNTYIFLTGKYFGRVSNLKGRDMLLRYLNETFISGNFDILGLPDTRNSFFFFDLKEFSSTVEDLNNIPSFPFYEQEKIKLPDILDKFGNVKYKGQLSGFLSELVAYGSFTTELGKFDTDISFQTSSVSSSAPALIGNIITYNFNLGKLIESQKLGNVSMNTNIDGKFGKEDGFAMTIDGGVSKLMFNNYLLRNIDIEGAFSERDFDGKVIINDPNLDLEFIGSFDFSDSIPHYNFETKINEANLYPLKIDTKDERSAISLIVKTNFYGNNLDNLKGEINLYNVNIERNNENYFFKEFNFEAINEEKFKKISFSSDLLKANIQGDFSFNAMLNSIHDFLSFYIPSISSKEIEDSINYKSKFDFEINLIYPEPIAKLYFPFIDMSPNTIIKGEYDIYSKNLNFESEIVYLDLFGKTFEDLYLNAYTRDSLLSINAGSRKFIYNKNHSLKNFSFSSSIQSDSINFNMNWNNWQEVNYSGNFSGNAKLKHSDYKYPSLELNILPSNIVMADTVWLTNSCSILLDSTQIQVNNFLFYNMEKSFSISGIISEYPTDSLFIFTQNIPLSYFNLFVKKEGISLEGQANGFTTISDFYNDRLFISNITIDNFELNNQELGNVQIKSKYNNILNRLELNATTNLNTLKSFELNGFYYPENKELDFKTTLNKFRLNIIEPYVKNLASDIYGLASGTINISGKLSNPVFLGKLDVQRGSFTINYLQTKYSLSDEVHITPKGFLFNDIDIYDVNGNKAVLNGYFNHQLFKNMDFDLTINPQNFQLLNTYEKDNPYFYGQAFGTGLVKIYGQPENVFIDISATTNNNTKIYIPLYGAEEVSQVDFINFIQKDTIENVEEITQYETDFSGIQMNFDLEVTPDAEIQLIFDKKVGDIIKGKGYSDLKMEIDTRGEFNMYGDFVIDQGDYLFTLQNVINKKFDIESGSKIMFNGDPYNALADIRAIYKVRKTSISEITLDPEDVNVRLPVNCYLIMTDKLMQPSILFDIEIVTQDENIKGIINSLSEDEKNKQLIYLLVLNKFLRRDREDPNLTSNTGTGVGTNVSELLSNQLSHWLSQISNDFDIGVNYRPGNELTTEEYEVALSTQLFNDRVTINSNVGMGGQEVTNQTNKDQNNVVGDFEVDVKLNKSGKLRVKAYTKANEDYIYDDARYKQGLSLYYKEEFNSFRELFRKYFNRNNKNMTN